MFQALEFSYIWVIQTREERGGCCLRCGLSKPVCAHKNHTRALTRRFWKALSFVKKMMENFSQDRLELCISTKLTPVFFYCFKSRCLTQWLSCTGHTSKWPSVIFGVQAEFTNHHFQYCPWSPSLDIFSLFASSEHALQALLDPIPSPLKSIVILTLSSIDTYNGRWLDVAI